MRLSHLHGTGDVSTQNRASKRAPSSVQHLLYIQMGLPRPWKSPKGNQSFIMVLPNLRMVFQMQQRQLPPLNFPCCILLVQPIQRPSTKLQKMLEFTVPLVQSQVHAITHHSSRKWGSLMVVAVVRQISQNSVLLIGHCHGYQLIYTRKGCFTCTTFKIMIQCMEIPIHAPPEPLVAHMPLTGLILKPYERHMRDIDSV